jgi:hypothetical protein
MRAGAPIWAVVKHAVETLFLFLIVGLLAAGYVHCGGSQDQDLCSCSPDEPDSADFRHLAKHIPLPNVPAQEIDVDTILSWPQGAALPPDAPRTGRELQLFHIAQAFVQNAHVNRGDCDIHVELSQIPDKTAPRVIVEIPVDSEYCSARKSLQSELSQHGFRLDAEHGGELPQPLPAEVLGMAFEDREHNRGSPQVATLWELHPATLKLLS